MTPRNLLPSLQSEVKRRLDPSLDPSLLSLRGPEGAVAISLRETFFMRLLRPRLAMTNSLMMRSFPRPVKRGEGRVRGFSSLIFPRPVKRGEGRVRGSLGVRGFLLSLRGPLGAEAISWRINPSLCPLPQGERELDCFARGSQ